MDSINKGYDDEAPPSYSQAVGNVPVFLPSTEGPKFTFLDFLPDGASCKYQDLIDKANAWLMRNRNFRLHSCESVIVLAKGGVVCVDSSTTHIPSKNHRDFAVILRCWLVKCDTPVETPQQIGTIARVPDRKRTLTVINAFGMQTAVFPFGDVFKNMTNCLEQLNEEIKANPIPGKILRVETLKMKVTDSHSRLINLDPNVLYWAEGDLQTMFVNYIRVFYIKGEPANEEIGWKDVVPSYDMANMQNLKFEPFSAAMYKAGQWAQAQTGKTITNIQTIDMPVEMDHVLPNRTSRPILDSSQSEFYNGGLFLARPVTTMMKFLRLFYVTSADSGVSNPYYLSHRAFLPYRLSMRAFELPQENVRRMNNWLSCNPGCVDDRIICAETIKFPLRLASAQPIDTEKNSYIDWAAGHEVLSGVRLYMSGPYTEPPIEVLGFPPVIIQPTTSSDCCTII